MRLVSTPPVVSALAHGARDRDEPRDTLAVLQPAVGHEHHAPRDDEREVSPPDERRQRDRVRVRVVRVDHVSVPGSEHRANPARGGDVPVAAYAHLGRGDPGRAEAADERDFGAAMTNGS